MSLGERICALRTQKHLSQGDLAEALEVSRQSISKWETGGSVPELDKLMRLSDIFGVSLDELVKGGPESRTSPEVSVPLEPAAPTAKSSGSTQKIVGVVLLCFGLFTALFLALLGGGLFFSLIFAAPFLLCAVVCLTARRHVGLWCAWSVYLCVDLYLRRATGITWGIIFQTIGFKPEWNYTRLAVGWAQFLFLLLLFACTLRAFRAVRISFGWKRIALLLCGWAALVGLFFLRRMTSVYLTTLLFRQEGYHLVFGGWFFLLNVCGSYLSLALLLSLLIWSLAALRYKKAQRA